MNQRLIDLLADLPPIPAGPAPRTPMRITRRYANKVRKMAPAMDDSSHGRSNWESGRALDALTYPGKG